jgi:MerR family regulatory protein
MMRIGQLAERSGVSVRALRYYEEQGLLEADRTPAGGRTRNPPLRRCASSSRCTRPG